MNTSGSTLNERLSPARRLRKRAQFLEAQRTGVRVRSAHFHFVVRANSGAPEGRLGIVVTRKLGNAVVRNRLKRWCREVFRRSTPRLPSGTDLVAIVRGPASELSLIATRGEFQGAWPMILRRASEGPSATKKGHVAR